MTLRKLLFGLTLGTLVLSSGCRHRCCKQNECALPPRSVIGAPIPLNERGGILPPTNISGPSNFRTPELLLPTNPSGASQYPPRNPNPGVRLYQPAPSEGVPETPTPSPMPNNSILKKISKMMIITSSSNMTTYRMIIMIISSSITSTFRNQMISPTCKNLRI